VHEAQPACVYFFHRLDLNTSKRGTALSKVYSIRVPMRMVARGNGLTLLWRAAQSVLDALRESRARASRRIIEDHRRLCGK